MEKNCKSKTFGKFLMETETTDYFKLGDDVRIIGKSEEIYNIILNNRTDLGIGIGKKGKIIEITETYKNKFYRIQLNEKYRHINIKRCYYTAESLEKIKNEEIEGEKVKSITIENLWSDIFCSNMKKNILMRFADEYGWTKVIPDEIALEFENLWGYEGWLVNNGFINQNKFYKIGDKFITSAGDKYVIACIEPYTIMAIGVNTGQRLTNNKVKVNSIRKISEEQIKKVFGYCIKFDNVIWENKNV